MTELYGIPISLKDAHTALHFAAMSVTHAWYFQYDIPEYKQGTLLSLVTGVVLRRTVPLQKALLANTYFCHSAWGHWRGDQNS